MAKKKKSKTPKLTAKQQLFIREYLIDLNATQAAIRAGYSKKNADKIGPALVGKSRVAEAINAAMAERTKQIDITADRVLQEAAKLAFSDVRRLFDAAGQILPVHEWPDDIASAVASIEVVTTRIPGEGPTDVQHTAKVRLWDKPRNLEMLAKYLKLLVELHEHSGPNGGPIKTQSSAPDLSKLSLDELKIYRDLVAKLTEASQSHAQPG